MMFSIYSGNDVREGGLRKKSIGNIEWNKWRWKWLGIFAKHTKH
jgi:hypothetical protein